MFIKSVYYFLIIVVWLFEVHSELCNTRTVVTRKALVTYTHFQRRGWIAKKWVTKSELKVIQKCCDGYRETHFHSRVACKPICKSNCENGYCEKPEVCACNSGYIKRSNTCVPAWDGDCLHGTCGVVPKTCPSRYNLVNGTCQPMCRNPCGNGTCVYPDHCNCFPGFQINYFRSFGYEIGPVCEPICKDCSGINCVGCRKNHKFTRSNQDTTTITHIPFVTMSTYNNYEYDTEDTRTITEDVLITNTTHNNYKYYTQDTTTTTKNPLETNTTHNNYDFHTEDTTTTTRNPLETNTTHNNYDFHTEDTTTTTRNPLETNTTHNNYDFHTEDTTTTTRNPHETNTTHNNYKYPTSTTTSVTTMPYFVSSSSVTVLDNNANNNVTSADMRQKSWMQQHGKYIWIPVLLILSTALILLLVRQGAPMAVINFYKGVKNRRSYNVQGAFRKQRISDAFERSRLEIIMPDERESQS